MNKPIRLLLAAAAVTSLTACARSEPEAATENVAWMCERMGVATGVDLARLVPLAREAAALPGAVAGGRVRAALLARAEVCAVAS